MLTWRSRLLVIAVAVVSSIVVGVTAATGDQSFVDPAGDANGAPDVTGVTISSDYATKMVDLTVHVPGFCAIDGATDPEVDVFFDIDRNPQTGTATGSEYDLYYWRTANNEGWDLAEATSNGYQEAPGAGVVFSGGCDTLEWQFSSKTDIPTTAFNVYVFTAKFDASHVIVAADFAPDDGKWTYDLAADAAAPALGRPLAVPTHPAHGKPFSVSFPVYRANTTNHLTGGTATASVTIGGKALPVRATLLNATANVALHIPAHAKGKTLVVRMTVTAPGGKTVTRSASFVIR